MPVEYVLGLKTRALALCVRAGLVQTPTLPIPFLLSFLPPPPLTERVGDEGTPITDMHVVPFDDIVDVGRDGGVRANAMFLHLLDQLTLSQITWRRRLPITKGEGSKTETLSFSEVRQLVLVLCEGRSR